MKTVLIDDEPIARRELARLLREHPEVEVVGEAGDAEEAKRCIERTDPELLFLDVRMPGASGFDLLEQLDEVPRVVFTTAYDHFAARAFDVDAADYLLKPVDPTRLAVAVERAQRALAADVPSSQPSPDTPQRIFVREGERCWFVDLAEVELFEANGNGSRVVFGDQSPPIRRTLASLERRLDPNLFFRANRSQIVSLRHVAQVEPWFGERLRLHLKSRRVVELSRRQATRFRALTL